MISVYLCGPINGCTDDEARSWRERAKAMIRGRRVVKILDPMDRDWRGNEANNAAAIVAADIADIAHSNALIANATRPSWGTAIEIRIAYAAGKQVFAFTGPSDRTISPWLEHHCYSIAGSLGGAVGSFLEWTRSFDRQA